MESRSVTLPNKLGAALHLSTFFPATSARVPYADTLVVFLNGLALPSSSWFPAAERLISHRHDEAGLPLLALLCYDRYGQGESDPDPTDPPGTPYGHDLSAAAEDLHALLTRVCCDYLDRELDNTRLVLVCNSIGCALARLYAGAHPGRVEGLLFLDSMMANTDFVSLFPDPDAATWGPDDDASLPPGVSPEDLRHARAEIAKLFHPTVPNRERLDRRYLPQLLPRADEPVLPPGPSGKMPLLTVVGHDWDTFAEENEQGPMKIPKEISTAYFNPAWAAYNEDLTKLAESEEVKIARGCGHFIQRDDPEFVASELSSLLDAISTR